MLLWASPAARNTAKLRAAMSDAKTMTQAIRKRGAFTAFLLVVEVGLYVEFGRKSGQDSLISGPVAPEKPGV